MAFLSRGGDPLDGLTRIRVRNYRALADIELDVGPINVVFGPNGAGKSTLLDTLYFFRDCAIRGVEVASSERSHGIGILWDKAEEDEGVSIELATSGVAYELAFSLSAGRIESFAGEKLRPASGAAALIDRSPGSDRAFLYETRLEQAVQINLREPQKLSLGLFLDVNRGHADAGYLDRLLHYTRSYHSRSFLLWRLKRHGSESSHETRLRDLGNNAWSVLRNLQDKRNVDDRYSTIMNYMAEAFTAFDDIVLEQTGTFLGLRQLPGKGSSPRDPRIRCFGRTPAAAAIADCPFLRRQAGIDSALRRAGSVSASLGPYRFREGRQARRRAMEQTGVRRDPLACSHQSVRTAGYPGRRSRRRPCPVRPA